VLASSYIRTGRPDDAEWEVQEVLVNRPEYTIRNVREGLPIAGKERLDAIAHDLRAAGLPE